MPRADSLFCKSRLTMGNDKPLHQGAHIHTQCLCSNMMRFNWWPVFPDAAGIALGQNEPILECPWLHRSLQPTL